jgi:hypothetical protein
MRLIIRHIPKGTLVAIAFLIVLTLACGVTDNGGVTTPVVQGTALPDQSDDAGQFEPITPTAQESPDQEATATPTPTVTPVGLMGGLVIGRANLVYTFKVKDGDTLIGEGEAIIPLRIKSTGEEGHYIYTENQPGTQVVSAAGVLEGNLCYITYTFTPTYSVDGDFYEDGCRFEFTIEVYSDPSAEVTENSCGYSISGDHFFFPPVIGPHVITEDNNPLTIKPDPRVTHIYSIEDVELPTSFTCW